MKLFFIFCGLLGVWPVHSQSQLHYEYIEKVNWTRKGTYSEYMGELQKKGQLYEPVELDDFVKLEKYLNESIHRNHQYNRYMLNYTLKEIDEWESARDNDAECLADKKYVQEHLLEPTFAAQERKLEEDFSNRSEIISTLIEKFEKMKSPAPGNTDNEVNLFYENKYHRKIDTTRETTKIAVDYFTELQANIAVFNEMRNKITRKLEESCGIKNTTRRVTDTSEPPHILSSIQMHVYKVSNEIHYSVMQISEAHKAFVNYTLHKLAKPSALALESAPATSISCSPALNATIQQLIEAQIQLDQEIISQCYDQFRYRVFNNWTLDEMSVVIPIGLNWFLLFGLKEQMPWQEFEAKLKYEVFTTHDLQEYKLKLQYVNCVDSVMPLMIKSLKIIEKLNLAKCGPAGTSNPMMSVSLDTPNKVEKFLGLFQKGDEIELTWALR